MELIRHSLSGDQFSQLIKGHSIYLQLMNNFPNDPVSMELALDDIGFNRMIHLIQEELDQIYKKYPQRDPNR